MGHQLSHQLGDFSLSRRRTGSAAAMPTYRQHRYQIFRPASRASTSSSRWAYERLGATVARATPPAGARLERGDEVLLSVLEHDRNLVLRQKLAERRGVVLRLLPITPDELLDLASSSPLAPG